jgi:hypothetical protein
MIRNVSDGRGLINDMQILRMSGIIAGLLVEFSPRRV